MIKYWLLCRACGCLSALRDSIAHAHSHRVRAAAVGMTSWIVLRGIIISWNYSRWIMWKVARSTWLPSKSIHSVCITFAQWTIVNGAFSSQKSARMPIWLLCLARTRLCARRNRKMKITTNRHTMLWRLLFCASFSSFATCFNILGAIAFRWRQSAPSDQTQIHQPEIIIHYSLI